VRSLTKLASADAPALTAPDAAPTS
jgi:hypothetical protein